MWLIQCDLKIKKKSQGDEEASIAMCRTLECMEQGVPGGVMGEY